MLAHPAAVGGTSSPLPNGAAALPCDTVLLVEDEESIGQLLAVLLERCHLRVLHACNGEACLRLFAEHRDAITLVLMDCGLPDVPGSTLCHRLRALDPGLPLLLTSGQKHDALFALLGADGPTGFIAKPFRPADVLREVQALLSRVAETPDRGP